MWPVVLILSLTLHNITPYSQAIYYLHWGIHHTQHSPWMIHHDFPYTIHYLLSPDVDNLKRSVKLTNETKPIKFLNFTMNRIVLDSFIHIYHPHLHPSSFTLWSLSWFRRLKDFKVAWLSNILTLIVPDYGYSRSVSCALNLISTFLFLERRLLLTRKLLV